MLVKREKSGSPDGNATPCSIEFRHLSALDILANRQLPKVGKTEKLSLLYPDASRQISADIRVGDRASAA
ncbi:MAG: hypothetical protein V7L29_22745 [Nostoc sp.]|uniref:hypothetical protein n=1 Tax=Nostoc sp. TaxID=1180 RepID=UPI002FF5B9D0